MYKKIHKSFIYCFAVLLLFSSICYAALNIKQTQPVKASNIIKTFDDDGSLRELTINNFTSKDDFLDNFFARDPLKNGYEYPAGTPNEEKKGQYNVDYNEDDNSVTIKNTISGALNYVLLNNSAQFKNYEVTMDVTFTKVTGLIIGGRGINNETSFVTAQGNNINFNNGAVSLESRKSSTYYSLKNEDESSTATYYTTGSRQSFTFGVVNNTVYYYFNPLKPGASSKSIQMAYSPHNKGVTGAFALRSSGVGESYKIHSFSFKKLDIDFDGQETGIAKLPFTDTVVNFDGSQQVQAQEFVNDLKFAGYRYDGSVNGVGEIGFDQNGALTIKNTNNNQYAMSSYSLGVNSMQNFTVMGDITVENGWFEVISKVQQVNSYTNNGYHFQIRADGTNSSLLLENRQGGIANLLGTAKTYIGKNIIFMLQSKVVDDSTQMTLTILNDGAVYTVTDSVINNQKGDIAFAVTNGSTEFAKTTINKLAIFTGASEEENPNIEWPGFFGAGDVNVAAKIESESLVLSVNDGKYNGQTREYSYWIKEKVELFKMDGQTEYTAVWSQVNSGYTNLKEMTFSNYQNYNFDDTFYILVRVKDVSGVYDYYKAVTLSQVANIVEDITINDSQLANVNYMATELINVISVQGNAQSYTLTDGQTELTEEADDFGAATFNYIAKSGTYNVTISAQDGLSKTFTVYGYNASQNYTIIDSVTINGSQKFNEATTHTQNVLLFDVQTQEVGSGSNYKIEILLGGKKYNLNSHIELSQYGVYNFTVNLINTDTNNVEDYFSGLYYYARLEDAATLDVECTSQVTKDEIITVTATNAQNMGDNVLYQLVRWDINGRRAVVDFNESAVFNFSLSQTGDYTFEVRAKGENAYTWEARQVFNIKVTGGGFADIVPQFAITDLNKDEVLELSARTPYLISVLGYQDIDAIFMFEVVTFGQSAIKSYYSPINSFVFIPEKAGEYAIYARVQLAGNRGFGDIALSFIITVN